jgi:hypothetical protein
MAKSKRLWFFCCKSGPISAYIQIPRTGYTVGQVIHISGEVDNKANITLNCSYAKLVQARVLTGLNLIKLLGTYLGA